MMISRLKVAAVVVAVLISNGPAMAIDTWTFRLGYSEPLEWARDEIYMHVQYTLGGEIIWWGHQLGMIYNDMAGPPNTAEFDGDQVIFGMPNVHLAVAMPAAGFWDDQPLDAVSRLSAGEWFIPALPDVSVTLLGVDYEMGPRGPASADIFPDGSVDALDAGILFFAWNSHPPLYDFNYDGYLDAADAGIMFAQWTGDAAPVPEPTAAVLFLMASATLRWRRCSC